MLTTPLDDTHIIKKPHNYLHIQVSTWILKQDPKDMQWNAVYSLLSANSAVVVCLPEALIETSAQKTKIHVSIPKGSNFKFGPFHLVVESKKIAVALSNIHFVSIPADPEHDCEGKLLPSRVGKFTLKPLKHKAVRDAARPQKAETGNWFQLSVDSLSATDSNKKQLERVTKGQQMTKATKTGGCGIWCSSHANIISQYCKITISRHFRLPGSNRATPKAKEKGRNPSFGHL